MAIAILLLMHRQINGSNTMVAEFKLNLKAISEISDQQFYQLCQDNSELKFERNASGEVLIMSPTGGETGLRNFEIICQFGAWNKTYDLGYCFDSSTCFKLPNGANRSPDVSFIVKAKWEQLSLLDRENFPPIAPVFVLELMSPSDQLKETQEYLGFAAQFFAFFELALNPAQLQFS